jgi:N-acetylated-alpha-linked acidic dipeptidase
VLLKELKDTDSVFSTRKVRLLNGVNDAITPIWNTMAVIPGHIRSEVVVVGNHRDAWVSTFAFRLIACSFDRPLKVLGAGDPTSGTVTMHEMTKYASIAVLSTKILRLLL